jgi:hypothetical protein
MAFTFQAYRNPYVSTIAELLSRGEDAKAKALVDVANAQARAAEIRGQAYGGAVQSIGQIASKALTDYTDPKRKLNDMALKQAESNARLDDATRDVLSQTMRPVITTTVPGVPFEASSVNVVPPTPQGVGSRAFGGVSFGAPVQPQASQPLFGRTEVGTQTVVPDSTFVQSQGPERPRFNDPGTGLFDINEVGKAYSNLRDKDGRPYSPAQIASRLEPIQKINESVLDFDAKQDSLEKSKQAAFGTMADGVIKYVEANGGSYINAARLAVTPWERRLGKDAVDTFLENFGKLSPTQQRGQLDALRNQAASLLPNKTLAEGAIEFDAFGREIARGGVKALPNPTRASFLRDATDSTKTLEERAIAQKNADDLKPVAADGSYTINGQRFNKESIKVGPLVPSQTVHTPRDPVVAAIAQERLDVILAGKDDQAKLAALPPDIRTAFIASVSSKSPEQRKMMLKDLVNQEDPSRQLQYMRNVALKSLNASDRSAIGGRLTALRQIDDIQETLSVLRQAKDGKPIPEGLIGFNVEKVKNFFGKTGNAEYKSLVAKLVTTLQAYRQSMTGKAFSSKESDEYKQFGIAPENLYRDMSWTDASIRGFKDSLRDQVVSQYGDALGQDYDYAEILVGRDKQKMAVDEFFSQSGR